MRRLASIVEKLVNISGYFAGWLVPLMMALVCVEVITRYVLHQPLMVGDEFSAYLLVALSYLGMAYTWRQGGHVRISVVITRLPPRIFSWIRVIGLIMVFAFMLELDWASYKMIMYALEINLRSPTWLRFPMFWPQLTVFIGFILLTALVVVEIFRNFAKIRAGEKVEA